MIPSAVYWFGCMGAGLLLIVGAIKALKWLKGKFQYPGIEDL